MIREFTDKPEFITPCKCGFRFAHTDVDLFQRRDAMCPRCSSLVELTNDFLLTYTINRVYRPMIEDKSEKFAYEDLTKPEIGL